MTQPLTPEHKLYKARKRTLEQLAEDVRNSGGEAPTIKEAFEFLLDLRDSGETNMMGAMPYLKTHFEITSNKLADEYVGVWMDSFRFTARKEGNVA